MKSIVLFVLALCIWFIPQLACAHCDTMEGPVVMTARAALEKGDVTPVLKWVRKEDENEIKELFKKTLAVRGKGPEAKELADMYFFETLVRIHRAGEGAPYTGLKNEPAEPIIVAADKALESGSVDILVKQVTDAVAKGIRDRYLHTAERKKHADESIEKGREFVEAYVEFTHYVERLHMDASSAGAHHEGMKEGLPAEHHH
jgi:hypothetical protein